MSDHPHPTAAEVHLQLYPRECQSCAHYQFRGFCEVIRLHTSEISSCDRYEPRKHVSQAEAPK